MRNSDDIVGDCRCEELPGIIFGFQISLIERRCW